MGLPASCQNLRILQRVEQFAIHCELVININNKDIGCLRSKWSGALFFYGKRFQLGSGSNSLISTATAAVC